MDTFEYDVCIVGGCGRVGLPLGLLLADRGQRVVLYDINAAAVAKVNAGQMPYREPDADAVLARVRQRTLSVTTDIDVVRRARIVILTIGTPVDEHINPHLTPVVRCVQDLAPHLQDTQTVILRSTVLPGTTAYVRDLLARAGKQPAVCFCPERVAEGAAFHEITSLPQLVAGMDDRGVEVARALFGLLTAELIVLTPIEAELTKLFTNVWRYMKFATANQFYMIAAEHGADFRKIGHAMRHAYPRGADFPRPGFTAGPCLFKDTMQLAAFYHHHFFLGHAAMLVNEGMPDFLRDQLKREHDLSQLTIGILGMTFKPEVDDIRESLAFKLKKLLLFEGTTVLCADEYWRDASLVDKSELIAKSDLIVIGCPHRAYRTLDFHGKRVVDIWESLEPL